MSSSASISRPSQRSRRASMAPSMGTAGLTSRGGGGSVSPKRAALRARVLREREGNASADGSFYSDGGSGIGAAKVGSTPAISKPLAKPSNRSQNQHMQFAFGSRVMKPKTNGPNAGQVAVGEFRPGSGSSGRAPSGPVTVDAAVLQRGRRGRSNSGHEVPEPRASSLVSRGRQAIETRAASPAPTREVDPEISALKKQLEDSEAKIALLRTRLDEHTEVEDKNDERDGTAAPGKEIECWTEADEAALRHVGDEARRETEEALVKVEATASVGLARTAEMQASIDEIIRKLKARH